MTNLARPRWVGQVVAPAAFSTPESRRGVVRGFESHRSDSLHGVCSGSCLARAAPATESSRDRVMFLLASDEEARRDPWSWVRGPGAGGATLRHAHRRGPRHASRPERLV